MAHGAPVIEDPFRQAVARFTLRLTKKELEDFKLSSVKDVQVAVNKIQDEQGQLKRIMNLTRIKRFIEAMDQFGKVIEVFLNASEFLCFVWGPMKFLLLVANTWVESFDKLLDAYEQLAENIPLLIQYQKLFEGNHHMTAVLSTMYEDILEFHQCALRVFAKSTWQRLFRAAWKDFKTKFEHLLENLKRHKILVETQANLNEIREAQIFRTLSQKSFMSIQEDERKRKHIAVVGWLSCADAQDDQEAASSARDGFPQTGRWVFDKTEMKAWMDPDNSSVPILWLNAIPGAGKTILTSVVIEKCRKVAATSTVFFYCKHLDSQRNTFLAIARAIFVQLLALNDDLLPHLHEQCLISGQSSLVSTQNCVDILKVALETMQKTYIIIDGIDECDLQERKAILTFFTSAIEQDSIPGRLRCLLVSQDWNDIKRHLRTAENLRISETDNKYDIRTYATKLSLQIQQKFQLTTEEQEYVISAVCGRAEEMFLFAKLVLTNLLSQTSKAQVYQELHPDTLPKGFEQAYGRILTRIWHNPKEPEREAARKLLQY